MKLCGIDPGNVQSAYIVWDSETKKILDKGILENSLFKVKLSTITADEFIIEMVSSYGMPVGESVFETCVWIGRFMETIYREKGHEAERIKRGQIKSEICRNSRAKDSNIRQALMDMYGSDRKVAVGTKKSPGPLYGVAKDEWSALAVCIAWYRIEEQKWEI